MKQKVQQELDTIVEAIDKRIDDRIDAIEVQAKRSTLSFDRKQSFMDVVCNCGYYSHDY